jgi:hypothetical protein
MLCIGKAILGKSITRIGMESADPIVDLIRKRILELLPFGLKFLWFPFKTDGMRELATVLGYTYENFKDMLKFSALKLSGKGRGGVSDTDQWQQLLRLNVTPYLKQVKNKPHEHWIRFDSAVDSTSKRASRSSKSCSSGDAGSYDNQVALACRPCDEQYLKYFDAYLVESVAAERK